MIIFAFNLNDRCSKYVHSQNKQNESSQHRQNTEVAAVASINSLEKRPYTAAALRIIGTRAANISFSAHNRPRSVWPLCPQDFPLLRSWSLSSMDVNGLYIVVHSDKSSGANKCMLLQYYSFSSSVLWISFSTNARDAINAQSAHPTVLLL